MTDDGHEIFTGVLWGIWLVAMAVLAVMLVSTCWGNA